MHIHTEKQLMYLGHPRTASTSTGIALETVGFVQVLNDPHLRIKDLPNWRRKALGMMDLKDWAIFTTVRNHWDAAVSWAIPRNDKPLPEEFTVDYFRKGLDEPWITEHELYSWHSHDATYFLRFEQLEVYLGYFLALRGLDPVSLGYFNDWRYRRLDREYRDFFTPETEDYVRIRFKEEIARFGYTF